MSEIIHEGELLKSWVHFKKPLIPVRRLLSRLGYTIHANLYHYYEVKEIRRSKLKQLCDALEITIEQFYKGPYNSEQKNVLQEPEITLSLHQGKQLKNLMEERGTSITHVSELLEVTRPTIYAWFDKTNLDDDALIKLSEHFKVPITYFTGKTNRKIRQYDFVNELQSAEHRINESLATMTNQITNQLVAIKKLLEKKR